jgi:hypothetical protein
MKKLAFIAVYVMRLSIDNVLGLVKSTINLAVMVKDDLGELSVATLNHLIANNLLFEPTVKNARKSAFTDRVNLANTNRKERFAEIKRIVKLHLKGRDTTRKAAAKTLDYFFSTYWGMINEPMNTVTGIVSGILEKYNADDDVQAAAVTLALDTLLAEFEASNKAFDVVYNQRLADDAAHELSASQQKTSVCDAYNEFCSAIEQAANYTPNESVLTLFNKMNELRKTYHTLEPVAKEKVIIVPPKKE